MYSYIYLYLCIHFYIILLIYDDSVQFDSSIQLDGSIQFDGGRRDKVVHVTIQELRTVRAEPTSRIGAEPVNGCVENRQTKSNRRAIYL